MPGLRAEWRVAGPSLRLAAALVAVASALSILFGLLNYPAIGHDGFLHLNWLEQYTALRERGILYPRWLPDSFGGFGSPAFYFYPPLPYWIASFAHSIYPFSALALNNGLSLIVSFASVCTAWILLRQHTSSTLISLTGALVYSFLSYRFCDVFVRDAFGEHWALMFLPLVFVGNRGQRGPMGQMGLLSTAWAGLFLTNLPMAYLAVLSITIWIAAERAWKEVPRQIASLLIAAMAAAVYIIPAITLRSDIHPRHLWDLPMHTSLFGFVILDLIEGQFDWLRVLSVGTMLAGVVMIVAKLRKSPEARSGWLWIAIVAVALQMPFLSPLWRILWGMPFVQFSWRWNGVLLLAIAALFVRNSNGWALPILIGLTLLTILSELTLSRNILIRPPLPINAYRMDAPEYAPKWAANDPGEVIAITQRRMGDPPATILGLAMPGDTVREISHSPERWAFDVHLQRTSSVRFHQFYWPLWHASSPESVRIPELQSDPNGLATLNLPAGNYHLILQLSAPASMATYEGVSWFGLSLILVALGLGGAKAFSASRQSVVKRQLSRL